MQVVPTEYYSRLGGVTETHQYSVTEYVSPIPADGSRPPAVDLIYDLSPIVVAINARPPSVLHYLVRISAVVGGVFAVTRECRQHGKGPVRHCIQCRACSLANTTLCIAPNSLLPGLLHLQAWLTGTSIGWSHSSASIINDASIVEGVWCTRFLTGKR